MKFTFFFLYSLVALGVSNAAHAGICERFHGTIAGVKANLGYAYGESRDYVKDVRHTYGLRLLLADVPQVEPDARWLTLFREEGTPYREGFFGRYLGRLLDVPNDILQWGPRRFSRWWFKEITGKTYEAHVFGFIYFNLIGRPMRWTTRKLGRKKDFSAPVKFLAGLVGFVLGHQYFSEEDDDRKKIKAGEIIQAKGPEWDPQIEQEFLYSEIRQQLDDKLISREDAREWAAIRQEHLRLYLEKRKEGLPRAKEDEWLLNNSAFFSHIATLWREGIPKIDGFRYPEPFERRISRQQLEALIDLQHETLEAQRQIRVVFVEHKGLKAAKAADPTLPILSEYLEKEPFAKALVRHHDLKTVRESEIIYRLQEDLFWRARYASYKTLGIVRLDPSDPTGETELTLSTIRTENIDEMNERLSR